MFGQNDSMMNADGEMIWTSSTPLKLNGKDANQRRGSIESSGTLYNTRRNFVTNANGQNSNKSNVAITNNRVTPTLSALATTHPYNLTQINGNNDKVDDDLEEESASINDDLKILLISKDATAVAGKNADPNVAKEDHS